MKFLFPVMKRTLNVSFEIHMCDPGKIYAHNKKEMETITKLMFIFWPVFYNKSSRNVKNKSKYN